MLGTPTWINVARAVLSAERRLRTSDEQLQHEIQAHKETEAALRESAERYRHMVEVARDIVYTTDHLGNFTYVNPTACTVTGYPTNEILGRHFTFLVAPDWVSRVESYYHTQFSNRSPETLLEFPIVTKTGDIKWVEQTVVLLTEGDHVTGFQAIVRDITARKKVEEEKAALEEQLIQSQKMEAVGKLAGGIAHDFNNLLTAVSGYAELAMMQTPVSDRTTQYLQEIHKSAARASDLTRQLLAFSRQQVFEPKVLDLNQLVIDLDRMLRRLIGEDIELVILTTQEKSAVHVDPGQMEQVIVNLAVNSRDSMPEGGKITIETSIVGYHDASSRPYREVPTGDYVLLTVTDTGTGITDEVKEHIFEPFFTTKDVGKGTGLGLSTCYGIVKQSGGYITVESEYGHGTTFRIHVPHVNEEVHYIQQQDELLYMPSGDETVLVVEDEPTVRALTSNILNQQGYTVLEASNGVEALRIAQEHLGTDIDILVTDVVMPLMSGLELADRFMSLHPDSTVLFMSGYTDHTVINNSELETDGNFMAKPFSPSTLAHKVREVIEKGALSKNA